MRDHEEDKRLRESEWYLAREEVRKLLHAHEEEERAREEEGGNDYWISEREEERRRIYEDMLMFLQDSLRIPHQIRDRQIRDRMKQMHMELDRLDHEEEDRDSENYRAREELRKLLQEEEERDIAIMEESGLSFSPPAPSERRRIYEQMLVFLQDNPLMPDHEVRDHMKHMHREVDRAEYGGDP